MSGKRIVWIPEDVRDGQRSPGRSIEVRYAKTQFTKGEAWDDLYCNPPTVEVHGRAYRAAGHELSAGKYANPWRQFHTAEFWTYSAELWIPGRAKKRTRKPKPPPKPRPNRYALLMDDGV